MAIHPQPGSARFVPRLGYGQQGLVDLLAAHGVRLTVAPLYYMGHNPELSLLPSKRQMGTVLDPCSHLRQRPWQDRAESFKQLAYGNEAEVYEPDRAALTDAELVQLAVDPLDLQRGRGATLLLTTFHVAGAIGTRGRTVELLLAEAGIEHFRRQGIAEPPGFAAVNVRREIYATIAVSVKDLLSSAARHDLIDAYLALAPDGFWVKIGGFHERASMAAIRAGGAFLAGLRESGKPVVSCGAGQLHLGLLADEISASIGLAESERFVLPTVWKNKAKKDGKIPGRKRMAYHPKYQWSFRVGSDEAVRAFKQAPCDCELHPKTKAPIGLVVAQHAAVTRATQAAEALDGDREDRREWLIASAKKASWIAEDAKVGDKRMSAVRYEALFAGLDAGDDVAVGEQSDL